MSLQHFAKVFAFFATLEVWICLEYLRRMAMSPMPPFTNVLDLGISACCVSRSKKW